MATAEKGDMLWQPNDSGDRQIALIMDRLRADYRGYLPSRLVGLPFFKSRRHKPLFQG